MISYKSLQIHHLIINNGLILIPYKYNSLKL